MSEIIKNYLNNEIQLSKKITGLKSIQREFKSGYLFGELLKKSKQVPIDLSLYNKNPLSQTEIKENFLQLKKDLKKIDLNINNYTIDEILANVPGSISNLLYKIKTQIDRRKISFDNILTKISNISNEEQKQKNYLVTEHLKLINIICNSTRSSGNFGYKNFLFDSINNINFEKEKQKTKNNFTNYLHLSTEENITPKKHLNNKIKLEPIKIKETLPKTNLIEKKNKLYSETLMNIINEENNLPIKSSEFTLTQNTNYSRNFSLDFPENLKYNYANKLIDNTISANKSLYDYNKNYFKYSSLDKGLTKIGLNINEIDPRIKKHCIPIENDYLLDKTIITNRFKQVVSLEKSKNDDKSSKTKNKKTNKFLKYSIISKNKINLNEKTPSTGYYKMCQYIKNFQNETKLAEAKNNLTKIKVDFSHIFNPYEKPNINNEIENEKEFHEKILKKFNSPAEEIEHENNYRDMLTVTDLIIDFTEECYRCQRKLEIEKVNLFDYQNWLDYFVNGKSCLGIPIKKNKGIGNDNNVTISREKKMELKEELRKNRNKSLLLRKNNLEFSSLEFNDYLYYRGYWCLENFVDENYYGTYLNIYDILGKDILTYISSGKSLLKGVKINDLSKMKNEEFELRDNEKDNIYLPKSNIRDEILGEIILLNFENLPENFDFDKFKIAKKRNSVIINNKNLLPIENINKSKEDLNNNTNVSRIEENKNDNSAVEGNKSLTEEKKIENNQNLENNNTNIKTENTNNIDLKKENENTDIKTETENNKLLKFNEIPEKNVGKEERINLSHIPIKICLIGHKYSGRKTQAKLLINKYPNIKMYSIDEIIDNYIKEYQKLHENDNNNHKSKSKNKNNANFEQLQLFAEISEIIEPLVLKKISELSIENKTKLLLDKIKKDFPFREQSEIEQENNNRNIKIEQLEQELKKYEEPDKNNKLKAKDAQHGKLTSELNRLKQEQYVGFILCDFPNNSEEILFFENKTTGYEQEIDKIPNIKENIYNKLTASIDKPHINLYKIQNNEIDNKELLNNSHNSIFNFYIYFEINEIETLERLKDRFIDPNTNIIYHTKFNPPPPDDKKLNERLVAMEEPDENEINEVISQFDTEIPLILNTLIIFNNVKKIKELNQEEIFDKFERIIIYNDEKKPENKDENEDEKKSVEENSEISSINNNENEINQINCANREELRKHQKKLIEIKKLINKVESENLILNWNKHNEYYCSSLKEFLLSLYNLKSDIVEQIDNIQEEFIDFINTPSQKIKLIEVFIKKYNSFMERYGYIKKNSLVIEEFEKNIVELSENIWELIQMKKIDLIQELETIIKHNYIGERIAIFGKSIIDLIILETKNYFEKVNLIQKFYYQIEKNNNINNELSETQFIFNENELLDDIENLPIYIDIKHSSPKLNALFKNCIKLLFKYDLLFLNDSHLDAENENAISRNLTSTSGIGTIKKKFTAFMKHSSHSNSENASEQLHMSNTKNNAYMSTQNALKKSNVNSFFAVNFEEDVKKCLKNEKIKYKMRILFLKCFGEKLLLEISNIKELAIKNLDKFIIDCVDAQNKAMNSLISNIRKEVFEDKKMKLIMDKNIELDIFNVYEKAKIQFNKFNLLNINSLDVKERLINFDLLKQIYYDIKNYEIQPGYITANTAIDILFKKHLFENKSVGFINYMKNIPFYFLNNFINKFITKGKNGLYIIKTNSLFTILAILNKPLLKFEQKNLMFQNSENKLISHCFLSKYYYSIINLWFEAEKPFEKEVNEDLRNKLVKHKTNRPIFTKNIDEFKNRKENHVKTNSEKFDRYKFLKSDDESETAKLKNFLFEINKNEYGEINFVEFLNVLSLGFCVGNFNKSLKFESKMKTLESQNNSVISADTTVKYSKEFPGKSSFNISNTFKNSMDLSLDNFTKVLEKNENGEESNIELTYFDILIRK